MGDARFIAGLECPALQKDREKTNEDNWESVYMSYWELINEAFLAILKYPDNERFQHTPVYISTYFNPAHVSDLRTGAIVEL